MGKKIVKVISVLLIVLFTLFTFSGCYGKFQLTRDLYEWNGKLGDKWVNSIVMWILMIVPVYSIAGFIDFVILNVIEFWTGSNPMAMAPGEKETQIVEMDGKVYEITATMNRFDIVEKGINTKISLVYEMESKAWFVISEDTGKHRVAQVDFQDSRILSLIQPNGHITKVDIEAN